MLISPWTVDSLKILTCSELARVLDDLGERSLRSASGRMNRVVFRLACCCGLRVSEIAALRVGDVAIGVSRPHLPKEPRPRLLPLRGLTIHHGRHTFISHALAGGRRLAEVKQAAGHSSLLTTSVYLHIAVEDEAARGDLFARSQH